ncbi:response regulator transcription factor [Caproiciproducens sp. MSJ-32]|uniref:response regulator transcription factor n=1 Tax=Caproiciproducens sp. MSJ-32 TaxID=2841527 RepID=UPI001C114F50|nr:response regulator transcription factor [Caproiciproducens sp. MSJ-32]MBU5455086.1 response regulator transcription factor [Caproiciproducens sp. MSJ-32]
MYRILIIEDDLVIAKSIKKHIKSWGYEVECVTDFKNVISDFISYDPQLVLLDISLPFFNGFHWCSEIRKLSKVPIIFISSASDNMNIVMAMNMGGDDFITKPFDLNVLTAKVMALLRRTYDFAGQTSLLEHRGVILNISDATLIYNNEKIQLTKNENKILHVLIENKGKSVTREDIMIKLWETDSYVDDNTLTVNVTRLRKKLQDIGLNNFIITKKGIGYMVE